MTTRVVLVALMTAAVAVLWPYVGYYALLWILHADSVGPTLVVIAAYTVLLVCSARARRFVLRVLNVVTLGVLGSAIARLNR